MDRQTFWSILEASLEVAGNHQANQLLALREHLSSLGVEEIVAFKSHFDDCLAESFTWDLWGAAFLLRGGCSDDGFLDFRCWLISRGRRVYEAALGDCQTLASETSYDDFTFEDLLYLPGEVWEAKTGKAAADLPRMGAAPLEDPRGEEWSEEGDDLKRRFPVIWKKFWDV